MVTSKQRKLARLESGIPDAISVNTYNLIIGGVVLYGFIANALIVWYCSSFFSSINPIYLLIGYFICCFAGVFITKSDTPLISFIGYNFVVVPIGAVLSVCLPNYPIDAILAAITVTGIVVAIMLTLSVAFPRFFAGMGKTLLFALIIGLVAEIVAMFLGYGGDIFNWFFVIVFSLYIGYDWYKAQAYPKTVDNAVDSALDIYLDIINLFMRILSTTNKRSKN